jgi:hypothetical protein
MTACRSPAPGGGGEEVVDEPRPHRYVVRHAGPEGVRVRGGLLRGNGHRPGQLAGGGLDERRGIRVTD